jgi:hypothetical protein
MWAIDSRWFDVAAVAVLHLVLFLGNWRILFLAPAWKLFVIPLRLFAILLALHVTLIETLGRGWAYSVFALIAAYLLFALALQRLKAIRIHTPVSRVR